MKECFGKFPKDFDECWDCRFLFLCMSYCVARENGDRCPLFGRGFDKESFICKVCLDLFNGKRCRELSRRR